MTAVHSIWAPSIAESDCLVSALGRGDALGDALGDAFGDALGEAFVAGLSASTALGGFGWASVCSQDLSEEVENTSR